MILRVAKIRGTLCFGGPKNKGYNILESVLGSHTLGNYLISKCKWETSPEKALSFHGR